MAHLCHRDIHRSAAISEQSAGQQIARDPARAAASVTVSQGVVNEGPVDRDDEDDEGRVDGLQMPRVVQKSAAHAGSSFSIPSTVYRARWFGLTRTGTKHPDRNTVVTETNAAPPGVWLADSERDTMLFVRAIPCWYGVSGFQAWAVRSGRVREWQATNEDDAVCSARLDEQHEDPHSGGAPSASCYARAMSEDLPMLPVISKPERISHLGGVKT